MIEPKRKNGQKNNCYDYKDEHSGRTSQVQAEEKYINQHRDGQKRENYTTLPGAFETDTAVTNR